MPDDRPARRGRGRPCAFTPERAELILSIVRSGQFLAPACQAAGVGRRTVVRWMTDGKREGSGDLYDFWLRYRTAVIEAENTIVAAVSSQASSGDLKSQQFYLERRAPQRWALRERREVTEMRERLDRMEKMLAGRIGTEEAAKPVESPTPEPRSELPADGPRNPMYPG